MKKLILMGVLISGLTSFSSCSNSASDPANTNAQLGYDSLSEVGDTVTQHSSAFSTAVHHLVNDLNQIPITGNADRDFALLIKSHHQGEIDIAQAQIKEGKNVTLKQIAQEIVSARTQEVSLLDTYVDSLKKGPLSVSADRDKNSAFSKIIDTHKSMMWDVSKLDTNMLADPKFVAVMIPHFQSSIYLSQEFLKYGKDPRLILKAKEVVSRNKKQLEQLNAWSAANKRIK